MEGQVKPELNSDFKDRAYQCGRLMAVLGKLQLEDNPDVKAGVVQRYYAAASTTPALVFGRLIRGAQFHLHKIAGERQWLATRYERRMSEICGRIGMSMPATLSLEEQSLFALGYYQQLAAPWAGKDRDDKGDE